jgi:hypothetical protein
MDVGRRVRVGPSVRVGSSLTAVAVDFIFVAAAVEISVAISVDVGVMVLVEAGVNEAGMGVKVGSSVATTAGFGGTSMVMFTFRGGSGVAEGELHPINRAIDKRSWIQRIEHVLSPPRYFHRLSGCCLDA